MKKRGSKIKAFSDLLRAAGKMDGGEKIKIALDKSALARKIYDAGRFAQSGN